MSNPPLPPGLSPPAYADAVAKIEKAFAASTTREEFAQFIRASLQNAFLDGVTAVLKFERARNHLKALKRESTV